MFDIDNLDYSKNRKNLYDRFYDHKRKLEDDVAKNGCGIFEFPRFHDEKDEKQVRSWISTKYNDNYKIHHDPIQKTLTIINPERIKFTNILKHQYKNLIRDFKNNDHGRVHFDRDLDPTYQQWAVEFYRTIYPDAHLIEFHKPSCLLVDLLPRFDSFDQKIPDIKKDIVLHGKSSFTFDSLKEELDNIDRERFRTHVKESLDMDLEINYDNLTNSWSFRDLNRLQFIKSLESMRTSIDNQLSTRGFAQVSLDTNIDDKKLQYLSEYFTYTFNKQYELYYHKNKGLFGIYPFDLTQIDEMSSNISQIREDLNIIKNNESPDDIQNLKKDIIDSTSPFLHVNENLNNIEEIVFQKIELKTMKIHELQQSLKSNITIVMDLCSRLEQEKNELIPIIPQDLRNLLTNKQYARDLKTEALDFVKHATPKNYETLDYYDKQICTLQIYNDFCASLIQKYKIQDGVINFIKNIYMDQQKTHSKTTELYKDQIINFENKVCKGNSRGTVGWITIPHNLMNRINLKNRYEIKFGSLDNNSYSIISTPKNQNRSWGFYLPEHLCIPNNLIGKKILISITETPCFSAKISEERAVIIPNGVVNEYKIQNNGLYEIEYEINGIKSRNYYQINETERSNRTNEFKFVIRDEIPSSTYAKFQIIRKLSKPLTLDSNEINIPIGSIFSDANCGMIDENSIIIFDGKKKPIICTPNIPIEKIIHYIGCYYADGSKTGSWSISASTPEQALYYKNSLSNIVKNLELSYELSYTKSINDLRSNSQLIEELTKFWFDRCGILINENRIRILHTSSDFSNKRNEFGSLRIRDQKGLVLDLHHKLMSKIGDELNHSNNKNLIWQFLFGVLEGDGFVSGGKSRFGVGFSCNIHNKNEIINYLNKLNIHTHYDDSKVTNNISNGFQVYFSLKEVILNLKIISQNIFIYYPKRRKLFIERLLNQPIIKYLRNNAGKKPAFISLLEKENYDVNLVKDLLNRLEMEGSKK